MRRGARGERKPRESLVTRVKRFIFMDDWPEEVREERGTNIVRLDFRRDPVIKHHRPKSFEDVELAADLLKGGAPVILTLERADGGEKGRMIDFMLGVTYALDGYVRKIATGVYMFSPAGIPIQGTEPETPTEPRFEFTDISEGSERW